MCEVGSIRSISVFNEKEQLFSSLQFNNLSLIKKQIQSGSKQLFYKYQNKNLLFITSPLVVNNTDLFISNVYDVSDVYVQRNKAYLFFSKLSILVIVLSAIVTKIFSSIITKPLKQLTKTSEKIANGHYEDRVEIYNKDEIGKLANSFNKMASKIEQKIADLKQVNKAKDEFVQNFTHELKTPMTSIMGYADLLRSQQTEPQVYIKAANYIYNESNRLNTLAMKLLDLMSLQNENLNINSISTNKLNLTIKNHKLAEALIIADKILIECVINNLYVNALNAGASCIELTGKVQKNSYKITINDNGCGIKQKHIKHLTEPFYMVDKSRSHNKGGSGLGLSLCNRILKLHGSKLIIKSKIGQQTTVSFTLPLANN